MAIRPLEDVVNRDVDRLKKYQSGDLKPIKTEREWLDSVFGGLIPQDIVTITGASGGGKSFEEQRVKNSVMDKSVNPDAGDYVWLSVALEMKFLSTMLRDMHRNLDKSKKEILTQPFTESEQRLVDNYLLSLKDGRFFIEEEALDADAFEKTMRIFLEQHADKKAVFISIDHIALMKNGASGDKKKAVDGVVEAINRLKKEFPNSIWIILSQLNRNILNRIKDKDIMAMPNRSDVFQSDTMFHISDYLYVCHNPYRLGINQFSKVNPKNYEYLDDHYGDTDAKGKVSFKTLGKMFYIVLKVREAEIVFKDIFIEDVDIGEYGKHTEDDFIKEIDEPDFDEDDTPF